jgi:hypothetical protein
MGISCPNCNSRKINVEETVIKSDICKFYDDLGKSHLHDHNSLTINHVCKKCRHEWTNYTPHNCWCGWVQEVEGSGYQGKRFTIKQFNAIMANIVNIFPKFEKY